MNRFVHASAVIVGERAVLIRGASGSGKSTLAMALIELAPTAGQFACLIGDDRVWLHAIHGRLIVRPHPRIAGLIEQYGTGLVSMAHASAGVVGLVADLAGAATETPRLPLPEASQTKVHDILLARVLLERKLQAQERAIRIFSALNANRHGTK